MNIKYQFAIVLAIIAIAFFFVEKKWKNEIKEKDNLIESLSAELIIWKDKDSLNHAKIQVLETAKVEDFLKIKSADSTITKLQKLVKKYEKQIKQQGSITVVTSDTDVAIETPTTITYKDTFPTYTSEFNLKNWVIGTTIANKDKTTIDLKIKNAYSVIIGEEKQGWFKPKKPFVEVINENPYTETTSLRTYKVSKDPVKKFGVGPVGAYGISLNGTPSFGGFLGVGVQYNLIRF